MNFETMVLVVKPVLIFIISFVIYLFIISFIKHKLLKRVKTKGMRHNVIVFGNIFTYVFIVTAVLMILFYFTGNFLAVGLTAGLMTAALGWALQRPITGVAAWIMVIIKKPFRIGDRILIGSVKGDVIDITLTHIYLKEVGGTISSEEISGRTVMIPNSIMFEQNIINYTSQDDYILDEVTTSITYESELDKAMKICNDAANKVLKDSLTSSPAKPYVRINFQSSGVDIRTRYYVKTADRIRVFSEVTHGIFKAFDKERDIEFAYPHTEVVLRNKTAKRIR